MDFIPEGSLAVDTDLDIRSVSVLWVDQKMTLDHTNCSPYEALGMLRAAVVRLEADCADDIRYLDEPEDEDEEDE